MSDGTPSIATPDQLAKVVALLREAGLPTDDLDAAAGRQTFWTVRRDGEMAGAIALEAYGQAGLLRSLVVAPRHRGAGLGIALVQAVERAARERGIEQMVLLTQTAEAFFRKLGYVRVDRTAVPPDVAENAQFHTLCPASATCMAKRLASR